MAYTPPRTIGSTHSKISDAKRELERRYSYADGVDDGSDIYTERLAEVLREFRDRVNDGVKRGKRTGPFITAPVDGIVPFDWTVQDQLGLLAATSPPPILPNPAFRNIWFYSAPGSGADWWVGPSFEVGEWCKSVLGINHQPIGFPKGGYMGLLGGDPGLSYNEVIHEQYLSLKHLLDTNEHVQRALRDPAKTDIEFWFSGYSQSADGMEDALEKLFGDGGPYAALRHRINGVIQFGNPSKKGTGIARKVRPLWLDLLVRNITTKGDFYAEAADDIRPLFYQEIVRAETSISFAGHIATIVVPVLLNLGGSIFGLQLGGMFNITSLLGAGTGGLVSTALRDAESHGHEEVDQKLIELLSLKGILTNIPALIGLLGALPGIQTHGEYHLPKPEFGGKTGIDVGRGIVAAFRR